MKKSNPQEPVLATYRPSSSSKDPIPPMPCPALPFHDQQLEEGDKSSQNENADDTAFLMDSESDGPPDLELLDIDSDGEHSNGDDQAHKRRKVTTEPLDDRIIFPAQGDNAQAASELRKQLLSAIKMPGRVPEPVTGSKPKKRLIDFHLI